LLSEKRKRIAPAFHQQSEISKSEVDRSAMFFRREATMRKHFAVFAVVLVMLGLCAPLGFAQSSATVKGVCKDVEGNPIVDGIVLFVSQTTGQKYQLKTNKKGEYYSLGLTSGTYNVTLYKDADDFKAGKELDRVANFPVALAENTLDFDLKKEKAAQGQTMTPEQAKQIQEVEKAKKENTTIKALNDKIVAANTAMKAGDYDGAINTLNEATQIDPARDLIWAQLADAYRGSGLKQTDPAEKSKRLQEAVADYQKAIELKQKAMESGTKKPEDTKQLAAYYNNLGEAAGKAGKVDEALKAYTLAAQVNPDGAAGYYYNAGAVLTNAGKIDDAIGAFDKCIAADPNKADAYYQKGVNMIGKATLQGDKMVAPPGTAEAFQKYLELQPAGPYADVAKQMLASIGAPVETGFGKKKAPPKK
jgi:tetratricopeptide (TPR) repeat protein